MESDYAFIWIRVCSLVCHQHRRHLLSLHKERWNHSWCCNDSSRPENGLVQAGGDVEACGWTAIAIDSVGASGGVVVWKRVCGKDEASEPQNLGSGWCWWLETAL
jgi:hypothetical protein